MSSCGKEILVNREGSDKHSRFPEALNPDLLKLNDFGLKDWMQFAVRFAAKINFFETENAEIPSGNWCDFFIADAEIDDFLQSVSTGNKIPPHLALFVCFVYLLGYTQKRFNLLTRRHLDFYFEKVLQTQKFKATPDEVYLIFELARNFTSEIVAAGTAVEAGKDSEGKKLIYKTTDELIVNKANLALVKTVYHNKAKGLFIADSDAPTLKLKETTDSTDKIPAGWWPFGYDNAPGFTDLPAAVSGFSVASGVLLMSSGERCVLISVQFEKPVKYFAADAIIGNLEVSCTGEKGWIAPINVLAQTTNSSGKPVFSTGLKNKGNQLDITFLIPAEEKAITGYNPKIHGGNYKSDLPVCRVYIKTGNSDGYQLYTALTAQKITNISIKTEVYGVLGSVVANDQGKLDTGKPFFAFGPQPLQNANLNLTNKEIFSKLWKKFHFSIDWKNTPSKVDGSKRDSFADVYLQYRKSYKHNAKAATYKSLSSGESDLIVENNDHFKASLAIFSKAKWQVAKPEIKLFRQNGDKFSTVETINNESFPTDDETIVRISLNQSFYHDMYPRIYALALSCNDTAVPLPNEPYTPLAENISVGYSAEADLIAYQTGKSAENVIDFYHEYPFGQVLIPIQKVKSVSLTPEYQHGGNLYLGIENISVNQQVSLLFQLAEGSENPEAESFGKNEKIEWSILGNNEWKLLGPESVICDKTQNFLQSGIVKIAIPSVATDNSSLLPASYFWLKASMNKAYDAVCKVIEIKTQAVPAQFENNNNELSHLSSGLKENSISKLAGKIPGIKGVTQPFSSTGGKAEEDSFAHYQRVAERLRHKNRAITLWDYEHLILQHFPEVYKIKCLNHTKQRVVDGAGKISFLSPGNILIVVIPDIQNKNVFDIFEPRVSAAGLKSIQDFVNKYNSLHVNACVVNPTYEKVSVSLKVRFRAGFDEIYYQQVLNDAIVKMLSPWAFDKSAALNFGLTLHRSTVINSIEKLEYVDYIEDVVLSKGTATNLVNATPENPVSILVSAKKHNITLSEKK